MLSIVLRIADEEPFPSSIIAITEATPITTPSVVSSERVGLRLTAFIAFNIVLWTFMRGAPRSLSKSRSLLAPAGQGPCAEKGFATISSTFFGFSLTTTSMPASRPSPLTSEAIPSLSRLSLLWV
jgi:hypothetical protein